MNSLFDLRAFKQGRVNKMRFRSKRFIYINLLLLLLVGCPNPPPIGNLVQPTLKCVCVTNDQNDYIAWWADKEPNQYEESSFTVKVNKTCANTNYCHDLIPGDGRRYKIAPLGSTINFSNATWQEDIPAFRNEKHWWAIGQASSPDFSTANHNDFITTESALLREKLSIQLDNINKSVQQGVLLVVAQKPDPYSLNSCTQACEDSSPFCRSFEINGYTSELRSFTELIMNPTNEVLSMREVTDIFNVRDECGREDTTIVEGVLRNPGPECSIEANLGLQPGWQQALEAYLKVEGDIEASYKTTNSHVDLVFRTGFEPQLTFNDADATKTYGGAIHNLRLSNQSIVFGVNDRTCVELLLE